MGKVFTIKKILISNKVFNNVETKEWTDTESCLSMDFGNRFFLSTTI